MSTPRINVDNHLMWGKLVKSWATGRDYVGHHVTDADPVPPEPAPGQPVPYPKPTSFSDLVKTCKDNHVGLHFVATAATPKTYCTGTENIGFVLLQGTSEISILRLPAKEKIHESEAALLGEGGVAPMDYALPSFYPALFAAGGPPPPMRQLGKSEKMDLHAQRVGEYTINTCT
jgi:hypothetical protein